jgi:acyl carrier protein
LRIGMTLKAQLKKLIVEELNLADIRPEDIGDDDPLFGDRFGLDSIDAVELVFQLKAQFGVEIKNMKEGRSVLQSINSISAFIEKRRGA